ncbi:MAG TPA: VWA domain-containing protein, partial [Pyrinomonadaceae bacterium]
MISIAFAVITALVSIFNLPTTARDFSPGPVREICEPSRLRTVTVSATTKAGASIDNLRSEDLTLSENKTPREILKLESAREQPLSIAILIDTSASQERTLEGTKLAAREFVQSILRADRDRAAVISFTDKITLEQDLTNDLTKLQAAIGRVRFVPPLGYLGRLIVGPPPRNPQHLPGATALWDAIADTVKTLQNEKDSRRVIVILTDGEDTFSRATLRDAAQQAAVNNVAVIAIGIADEKKFSLNREQLQKLADETGGR